MKFFIAIIDDCPRLDITGLTAADASHRAAKVLGGRELSALKASNRIRFKQVKMDVMV